MNNIIPYPTMPVASKDATGIKDIKYINILSKIATDITNPVRANARLAACIVYKNDIVAFGVNEMKSHPFQAKYSKNIESVFLHAETSAIKNALKYVNVEELSRCTLYVCRVKHYDHTKKRLVFGLSRPCPGCFRCINTFDIKRVVYTDDNQQLSVM